MDSNNVDPSNARDRPTGSGEEQGLHELVGIETAPQRAIGRAGSRLLSLLGLLLLGGGAAMAASPFYSWRILQLTELLATLGVHSGALALSGMVLIGTGAVGRSLARLAERPRVTDNGMVDAVERMADQISLLAGSLTHLHEQVTNLSLRDPIVHVDAPAPDEDLVQLYRDQKDAVFQLAAGLDKLGRQMSDQLAAELHKLEHRFEGLRETIKESESQVSARLQQQHAVPTSAPIAHHPHPVSTPAPAEPVQGLQSSQVQQFSDSMPMPTEIVLEEPHPELEPEVSPLAFLDGLKSIEPPSQNPHSPSVATPNLDFDLLDGPTMSNNVDGPAAALPGTPNPQNQRTPQ